MAATFQCDQCGDESTAPAGCRVCEGIFCRRHTLPAHHDCRSPEGGTDDGISWSATIAVVLLVLLAGLTLGAFVVGDLVDGTDDLLGGEQGDLDSPPSDGTPTGEGLDEAAVEALIHERINDIRAEHNLSELSYNVDLAVVAHEHSVHMAEADFFAHEDPDGNGPADRVEADDNVSCDGVGENLAQAYWQQQFTNYDGETIRLDTEEELAQWFVDAWMDSEGHRENILQDEWDEQGLGVHLDDDGRVFATQKFCHDAGGWFGVLAMGNQPGVASTAA